LASTFVLRFAGMRIRFAAPLMAAGVLTLTAMLLTWGRFSVFRVGGYRRVFGGFARATARGTDENSAESGGD
jgi:hypothetical protein